MALRSTLFYPMPSNTRSSAALSPPCTSQASQYQEYIKNLSLDELLQVIESSNRIIFETEKYLNEALHFTVANGEKDSESTLSSTSEMDEYKQMQEIFNKHITLRRQADEALAVFKCRRNETGFTHPA